MYTNSGPHFINICTLLIRETFFNGCTNSQEFPKGYEQKGWPNVKQRWETSINNLPLGYDPV